jgi:hypothetical protein
MVPHRQDIAAPELPPRTRWLGDDPGQMSELTARGPVLVHFFDFAQLNCVRSMPYVVEWSRRYAELGLLTLGVHSPRHPFTGEKEALEAGIAGLGIEHPVADDSGYALWHDYGCEGWPSLFLWGRGGALRWFHFGEGEYEATELAIQEELRGSMSAESLPEPVAPLRPSDAPGATVVAPTPEILPGGSAREPWVGGHEELLVDYAAGGVYAAVDGEGSLSVRIDDGAVREITVSAASLVELAAHARHEAHSLALAASSGVRVWAISFAAGTP